MSLTHARTKAVTGYRIVATTAVVAALTLTGCSSDGGSGGASPSTKASTKVDAAARALLPASIRDKGTLTVASTLAYAPFEYKEKDGTNTGVDIELMNAVGQALGVKIKIQQTPFDGEIAGLASNRFDLAWASFTITPERRKQVNFVQFSTAGTQVSVVKGSSTGITGVDSLCGKKVGVSTGSAAQTQAADLSSACTKAGKSAIDVSVFQSQTALVQGLLNGRVSAKLDDSSTVDYINKQTGNKLEDVGTPYLPSPVGFAVAKNTPELLKAAGAALQSIMDDGTYGKIMAKWGQTSNAVKTAKTFA